MLDPHPPVAASALLSPARWTTSPAMGHGLLLLLGLELQLLMLGLYPRRVVMQRWWHLLVGEGSGARRWGAGASV